MAIRFAGYVESIKENVVVCYDELFFIYREQESTPEWVEIYKGPPGGRNPMGLTDGTGVAVLPVDGGDELPYLVEFGAISIRDVVSDVLRLRSPRCSVINPTPTKLTIDFPEKFDYYVKRVTGSISKRVMLRGMLGGSYHYGIDPRAPDVFYVRPKYRMKSSSFVSKPTKFEDVDQIEIVDADYTEDTQDLAGIWNLYGRPEEVQITDTFMLMDSLTKPTHDIIGILYTYEKRAGGTGSMYYHRDLNGNEVTSKEEILEKVDYVHELHNRNMLLEMSKKRAEAEWENKNSKRFSGNITILGHPIIFAGDLLSYKDRYYDPEVYDSEFKVFTVIESIDNYSIHQTLTME